MKSISRLIVPALAVACVATFFVTARSKATVPTDGKTTPPVTLANAVSIELPGGVKMEFVLIGPGSFIMGSDENTGDGDESPQHKVTISQPFYLGKYEVTQEQWEAVVGGHPSKFKGPTRPVDTVSWNDCQQFLAKLQEKTGRRFALPTEAQWEFACRAGTTTLWNFGHTPEPATDYAWIGVNAGGTTHPVGEKKPNPWGLYDMNGNVGEWCADWYAKHSYDGGEVTDPLGPAAGDARILRGGAWGDQPDNARSASRNCIGPDIGHGGTGLRCVMLADVSPP